MRSTARSWPEKFRDAFRGIGRAVATERSFWVHVPIALAVALAAAILRVTLVEACLLGLCIALVMALEAMNTALEHLAREITTDQRPNIAAALDIASGAVLLASLASATIGAAIFLPHLWKLTITAN